MAQEAHRARTRGKRPRVSTQVHVDARVGHHVASEVGRCRAHGIVGPGKELGAVTQKRYRTPLFKLTNRHIFFHMGLCPTRFLLFASDMATQWASDSIKTKEIAWTRVHAIVNQAHA